MKSLKILVIALFAICIFNVDNANAQAEQKYAYDIEMYLVSVSTGDTAFVISSGIEQVVVTPIGNYLRMVTFKIADEEPIMEIANPFAFLRLTATGDFDGDGFDETLVDNRSILTKNGNLKFVYHNIEK
jgi:hypothetical protein